MKSLLGGLGIAFSMFSALPVPQVEWKGKSMKRMLLFLPLVGMVVGLGEFLWLCLGERMGLAPGLTAAIAVLLPLGITGGVHLDGLADTADALGSRQGRERKLEILSDPHIGAFGVLGLAAYLLASVGSWLQVVRAPRLLLLAVAGPAAARCLGAAALVVLPLAKETGLAAYFVGEASRKTVALGCGVALLGLWGWGMRISPLWGGVAAGGSVLLMIWFRAKCRREFGGVTGDLIGWLIQLVELLYVLIAALGGALV